MTDLKVCISDFAIIVSSIKSPIGSFDLAKGSSDRLPSAGKTLAKPPH